MKKYVSFILIFCLSGCGVTAKFVYPEKRSSLLQLYEKPKYDLSVAVLPFEENRNETNSFGRFFLYMVPLVPYGIITYERPDAARIFNSINEFDFNVSEDIAKAVVTSVRHSNLFENVYFTYGGDRDKADIVITGTIESTRYEGKTYSYGLSVVGPLLWFVGFPAGTSFNEIGLRMEARKQDTKELLWDYHFTKNETINQGLYYRFGHDVKQYAPLMQDGMNDALRSLNEKLSTMSLAEVNG